MTSVPPVPTAQLRGAIDLSPLVNRPAPASPAPAGRSSAPGPAARPSSASSDALVVPAFVLEGTDQNFAQFLELSNRIPLIVDLWAQWCTPCKELSPILEKVVADLNGRLLLVTVDVDSNPQLAQAFQAQSIPTVAAILGGRPLSLFVGALPEAQVREVFEQLLVLAAQNGVTGTAILADGSPEEETAEPEEAPLPPHHAAAYAAIERGDFQAAMAEYRTAIAQDPRDALAVAGLAQVSLLARLDGKEADQVRAAAAQTPLDVAAQLDVADLDLAGGHVEDAFGRLLDLFPRLDAEGKTAVRTRLVELFEVVGVEDPRVVAARRSLTMLLY